MTKDDLFWKNLHEGLAEFIHTSMPTIGKREIEEHTNCALGALRSGLSFENFTQMSGALRGEANMAYEISDACPRKGSVVVFHFLPRKGFEG